MKDNSEIGSSSDPDSDNVQGQWVGFEPDTALGRRAHALVATYVFRLIGANPADRGRLLSELTQELYRLHAKARVKVIRPGHLEDVTAFDNEHHFRAELSVWHLLARVPLTQADKDDVALALAGCRSDWADQALERFESSQLHL